MMRFFTNPHRFCCGIDRHARIMHVCILDHEGTVVLDRNLPCNFPSLLEAIAPFRDGIVIGVECMFGWYWLADRCAEHNRAGELKRRTEARQGRARRTGAPTTRWER
jgi:hypothetical protein